jgi:aldehyde dehydrogenase (NAD+)
MADLFKNLVGGKWLTAGSGKTFENRNPANQDDLIGHFPSSGPEDVDAAVGAAKAAFASWRLVPAPKRGEILYRAGELLKKYKEELARIETREMGKVLKETRGDVQEGIDCAFCNAGEGRRLFGETTPSELPNKFAMSVRTPIGVCALITPWNFPLAIPSWKLFPALICGNTVILKPAEDTPHTAVRFVEILTEAGVPPGVINLIHGRGEEVGAALVQHRDVQLVSFTGSAAVGREIASVCGQNLKRVSLELGGKNAQIVMEDADLELAVEGALWGAFGTTGQRCTATSRLIVHRDVAKKITDQLVARASTARLTVCPVRSTPTTWPEPFAPCATSRPVSPMSTVRRSAPKSIFPSAALKTRVMVTVRRAPPCTIFSPSGNRFTSIIRENCRRRRSITTERLASRVLSLALAGDAY